MFGRIPRRWSLAALVGSCRDRVAQCVCQPVVRPRLLGTASLALFVGLVAFVAAAGAQPPTPTPTSAAASGPVKVCTTALADTVRNIILMIQLGGPLIGGTVGIAAMVLKPLVRGEDLKRKLKQLRDGGIFWGVIIAPLSITSLQFLVNSIVVGGSTCSF